MKRRLILPIIFLAAFIFTLFYAQSPSSSVKSSTLEKTAGNLSEIRPQNVKAAVAAVSRKVGSLAPASPADGVTNKKSADEKARSVPNREPFRKQSAGNFSENDGSRAEFSTAPMPSPSLSFNGLSSNDNVAAYGLRIVPPDPFGDVGPNHFVQAVNALVRVFDKQGNALTPPFKLSSLFAPLGTPCSARNDGDPIVLYDALANRWFLSQFCTQFPPFRQLIAVSRTGDPTGEYYIYEFVMPNIKLNDYSKIGVWSDAFYMTTDQYIGGDYAGTGVFAFDREKILAGDAAASYIYFDLSSPSTIRLGGLLPADLDGLRAPPNGAPNIFAGYSATEYGDARDAIRLFEFHADFANPENSTFTERPESPLAVAAFDPTSPDGREDIVQPAHGSKLDSQSDRLMFRAAYRNFGTEESVILNQTVRTSAAGQAYRAGVRVHELRKSNGIFSVREQATIGDDKTSRWMAGAAQDYQGNIAAAYSVSSEEKKPSIFYTGRAANEPAGIFRSEAELIAGTGVQKAFGSRWGDYSALSVDPSDDCSFWLTNEYYTLESQDESEFGWLTRVGKFKFSECSSAPQSKIKGTVVNSQTDQPLANVKITANEVYSRNTNAAGDYGEFSLPPGEYVLTASARGFRSQTFSVNVADGQTLTQNFALQPTALFENPSVNIKSESCAANSAVEPGETVTVEIALQNIGANAATNLTATLLPTGGVMNPSQTQNYGGLAVGASALRSFTFTASPNLNCGDALILSLELKDGAENLGTVSVNIFTGKQRVAFREDFGYQTPDLPPGWTTSATGAQEIWRRVLNRHQTPPASAFSPAPNQVGLNEMTSPAIKIESPDAEIQFRNWYDLETTFLKNRLYDGSVFEIKIGRSRLWQDIEAAGGVFLSGGYDGVIDGCCQNPLAGRRGWSGKSGVNQNAEFITSKIKLPATAAGQDIQIRFRVGTDTGTFREGQYIDDLTITDGFVCECQKSPKNNSIFDFDGDGKTDISTFRPNDNPNDADFFVLKSSDNLPQNTAWGSSGDTAVNADYDGDGKTDFAVFRPAARTWFILRSSNLTIQTVVFGSADDKLIPADYDGDRKADVAVFRPSDGFWYGLRSSNGEFFAVRFGIAEDLPVPADYDGDGRTDIAVFRPSVGNWYVSRSSDGEFAGVRFGAGGDKPVAGDYDGDGRADFTVFRPSEGNWYLLRSQKGFAGVHFGANGDKPLQADFDGDGKHDIAVFRPSDGGWYFLKSSNGEFSAIRFGTKNDMPVPSIFIH